MITRSALIGLALLLEIGAWRAVARGRGATEWNLMTAVFLVQGAIALAVWDVDWSTDRSIGVSVSFGLASGVLLYGGTRAFVGVAQRAPVFRRHVIERYQHARLVPLPAGLAIAVLVAVPAEELFWRGLVQGLVSDHSTALAGMLAALSGYVVAKVASGSLPLIAGAIVGGAVWGALAVFAGGILAALLCHGVWTGLMLAFPPAAARPDVATSEMMTA